MSDKPDVAAELIGQLNAYANSQHHSFITTQQMAREAAAELTRLAAENQRFKELIKSETAWLRSLGPKESDEGNGEEIENALIKAKAEVDRLRSGITPNVSREYYTDDENCDWPRCGCCADAACAEALPLMTDTGEKPSPLQAMADILKPFTFKGVKPDTGETP